MNLVLTNKREIYKWGRLASEKDKLLKLTEKDKEMKQNYNIEKASLDSKLFK